MTDDLKSGPYDQDDGHRAGCDRRPCMCPPRSTTAQLDRDLLHTGEARAEVTDQGLRRIPPTEVFRIELTVTAPAPELPKVKRALDAALAPWPASLGAPVRMYQAWLDDKETDR